MKYKYFLRPGYKDFLRRVHDEHPRVRLGFYSSIMFKNIQPVMLKVLVGELEALRSDFVVFDQKYNKLMKDHPYYTNLKKDNWETYRDLNLVWEHVICVEKGFNATNTLMIDSSEIKVQLYRDNCIVSKAYELSDVQLLIDDQNIVRGREWHIDHMNRLADFVNKMADNVDIDVVEWLRHNRPAEYEPANLLQAQ